MNDSPFKVILTQIIFHVNKSKYLRNLSNHCCCISNKDTSSLQKRLVCFVQNLHQCKYRLVQNHLGCICWLLRLQQHQIPLLAKLHHHTKKGYLVQFQLGVQRHLLRASKSLLQQLLRFSFALPHHKGMCKEHVCGNLSYGKHRRICF